MRKWIGTAAMLLALTFALTGCGRWGIFSNEIDDALLEAQNREWYGAGPGYDDPEYYEDYGSTYTGAPGDVMDSCFFSFMVEAPELLDSCEGYAAPAGCQLLKTTITVHNTFGEELPMSIYDFQVQWGPGDEDFGYEAPAFWEIYGHMPEYYALPADGTFTYYVVYEVPAGSTEFSVSYLERFTDGTTGDVYFVYFSVDQNVNTASRSTGTAL